MNAAMMRFYFWIPMLACLLGGSLLAAEDSGEGTLDPSKRPKSWEEPASPLKIAGPLYFVGTKGLGVYLFTTSEGLILLNTGMPGSGPMIEASIRKLGFKVEDIKILITGHAHTDHVGAMAYMKEATKAQLAVMEQDVPSMEDGGQSDFYYGKDWKIMGFPPVKVDRALRDGDTVKLGEVELKARLTPGHTRGCTTWVTNIEEGGKTYNVVFADGTNFKEGYRLAGKPSYPGIAEDFAKSFATLETLTPDIWVANHTAFFGFKAKSELAPKEGVAAWVDPKGYTKYVAKKKAAFNAELARQLAEAKAAPAP